MVIAVGEASLLVAGLLTKVKVFKQPGWEFLAAEAEAPASAGTRHDPCGHWHDERSGSESVVWEFFEQPDKL